VNSGVQGFPSDPGTPAAVTGGIDYAVANGLLVGAAVSYGHTTQGFDLGGNFKQSEIAGSLSWRLRRRPLLEQGHRIIWRSQL